jgi:hypothetical protein
LERAQPRQRPRHLGGRRGLGDGGGARASRSQLELAAERRRAAAGCRRACARARLSQRRRHALENRARRLGKRRVSAPAWRRAQSRVFAAMLNYSQHAGKKTRWLPTWPDLPRAQQMSVVGRSTLRLVDAMVADDRRALAQAGSAMRATKRAHAEATRALTTKWTRGRPDDRDVSAIQDSRGVIIQLEIKQREHTCQAWYGPRVPCAELCMARPALRAPAGREPPHAHARSLAQH